PIPQRRRPVAVALPEVSLADAVVVTGDSVSMVCEACAATAPVFVYAPPGMVGEKHARLHRDLFEMGYARPLGERLEHFAHPPLNAARDIADEIRRRAGFGA
ncbi:MAG: mitochondrial fission ELM1 family protein, partial [Alphaproteobacteria bacterium]|nr:mitochondrial fission ELM1 family protein [Alphaproteobacteria bacterium]